jgi:hypothetical protein
VVEGTEARGATRGGSASIRFLGPQEAVITVTGVRGPALVVVHDTFDPNWHAEVDGSPVTVLRTDYLLQGVLVPRGAPGQVTTRHKIVLRYDDPTIGYGLLGSVLSIAALLGVALVLRRRTAVRASVAESPEDADGGRTDDRVEAP